jgi:hypothetical protein
MGSSSSIGSEVRSAKPEAKEQREKPTVTRANSADGRFHTIPDPNRPSFVPSLKLDKARPLARRRRRPTALLIASRGPLRAAIAVHRLCLWPPTGLPPL